MKSRKKQLPNTLIPGIIILFLFMIWAVLVASKAGFINIFDNFYINLLCNKNPANIHFAKTFTVLGNTSTILIETIILFVVLLIFRKFAYAIFTAGTMICANGCNWILKHIIQRSRPSVRHLIYADGYSFPSGHSVGSAALAGVLIVLTTLIIKKKLPKLVLCFIWFLFPLIIGYTRIFLHVHYPSDVFGGWMEGIAFVLLCKAAFDYFYLNKTEIH